MTSPGVPPIPLEDLPEDLPDLDDLEEEAMMRLTPRSRRRFQNPPPPSQPPPGLLPPTRGPLPRPNLQRERSRSFSHLPAAHYDRQLANTVPGALDEEADIAYWLDEMYHSMNVYPVEWNMAQPGREPIPPQRIPYFKHLVSKIIDLCGQISGKLNRIKAYYDENDAFQAYKHLAEVYPMFEEIHNTHGFCDQRITPTVDWVAVYAMYTLNATLVNPHMPVARYASVAKRLVAAVICIRDHTINVHHWLAPQGPKGLKQKPVKKLF